MNTTRKIRDQILGWYMRTPEHPTKYRVVRWLGRNCFPENGIIAKVPPGIDLYLHPRDWIEYRLLRTNDYEPLTLDFIRLNLRRGESAVFAGVNFGLHVLAAAHAVGAGGRVIGIEPQPAALLRARMNVELNRMTDRVQLISAALGATAGFAHMAWSKVDENAGAASLLDEGDGLSVRLIPISEVLKTRPADFFLLDVEGYELNVLAGLSPECAPRMVIVEVQPDHLKRAGSSAAELLRRLRSLGYHLHTLNGIEVNQGDEELPEHNVVGIRNGVEPIWALSN